MTPSGDPLRIAFASPLRRDFGYPLRRAFENFLKPPQESHHFKFLLDLFKFIVHRKAEWRSGLRRWNCERMRVRMKVEGGSWVRAPKPAVLFRNCEVDKNK